MLKIKVYNMNNRQIAKAGLTETGWERQIGNTSQPFTYRYDVKSSTKMKVTEWIYRETLQTSGLDHHIFYVTEYTNYN